MKRAAVFLALMLSGAVTGSHAQVLWGCPIVDEWDDGTSQLAVELCGPILCSCYYFENDHWHATTKD